MTRSKAQQEKETPLEDVKRIDKLCDEIGNLQETIRDNDREMRHMSAKIDKQHRLIEGWRMYSAELKKEAYIHKINSILGGTQK